MGRLLLEDINRMKTLMGLINEQKTSLPIVVKGSYSAPKGDADALHSFERRKSDGFGGRMLTKINEKLKEVYSAGINPDVTNIKIDIDSTNYVVRWEATIDESKDGVAYMGVGSRGSAGRTADRRAENQIDNLMRKLKRNGADNIELVLDFKNPSGVYIRQYFYKYSLPKTNPPLSGRGDYVRTETPTEVETTLDDVIFGGGGSTEEVSPSTSGKYSPCEDGTFKKGCKDPNTAYKNADPDGTIYKIQGCVGAVQDGYFGNKTEAALLEKTGKKEFDTEEISDICKDVKPAETVIGGSSNFENITKTVIDKFEGGYWNPFCKHPSSGMGKSTETMFGLDRFNGNIESTPEGKEFFKIIDDEKINNGAKSSGSGRNAKWSNMDKFCGEWKWSYRGGDKEEALKNLAIKIMKRSFDRNMSNFVKDPQTKAKIETIPGLTLHMSYATWNGPGFFKKFANSLEQGVSRGMSDKQLIDLAISDRNNSRLLNKNKVEAAIRNPN